MVMTKTAPSDSKQSLELVNNFLKAFEHCCNQSQAPKTADLEQYLSPYFRISNNGNVVEKSLSGYIERIAKFQKKYSKLEISKYTEEALANGKKFVVHYRVDTTNRNGSKGQIYVMALATVEDHKISEWTQVGCEKASH